MFTPELLKSVAAQIVEKCDVLDGVKDGLLEDPRRCNVDIAGLAGLSDGQRAALRKIYAETSGKGGATYPARPVGGEGEVDSWPAWITGGSRHATPQAPSLGFAVATHFFKFLVVPRSLMGLQRLRRRERAQGREARGDVHERDQSGSRRVQGETAGEQPERNRPTEPRYATVLRPPASITTAVMQGRHETPRGWTVVGAHRQWVG